MEVTRSGWGQWRRYMPVLAPALIGVVLFALGHTDRAVLLWVIAGAVGVLIVAGVPVHEYVARGAAAIAHGLGVVATGAVGLLLVGAGGVLRLFGRDPLTPRSRRGNAWQAAASARQSDRLATATYGVERSGPEATASLPRRFARGTVLVVGTVVLLLALDLGVGLGWERISGPGSTVGEFADAVNFTGRTDTRPDSRADLPAMAAYPWADEYFREIQTTPSSYWPFTESRPRDFEGEYVNIEDWARATYVPTGLDDDAPVVWMFGGSTTWGEGQRDEYTIASYVSRLAEEAGTPIRMRNYGQRGWTHFQEMILFEQLLAEGPPPDLAVFYDGANEINAQSLTAKGVPTHTLADQYAELISGGIAEEFAIEDAVAPPSEALGTWRYYLTHSAIRKVVGRIRDELDPPAGASTSASVASSGGDDAGAGQIYVKTVDDARRAVDVYERGRVLTAALAEQYDVDLELFWQPVLGDAAPEQWADANVGEPTVNISDALDARPDVYIDGGHTNEEGARIVAERIWAQIRPTISDYYSAGR